MTDTLKTKYQWLYTKADEYAFLHYIAEVTAWDEKFFDAYDAQFTGPKPWTSLCGLNVLFVAPGLFSRLGAPRCEECCKELGIPSGEGCPINDKKLHDE